MLWSSLFFTILFSCIQIVQRCFNHIQIVSNTFNFNIHFEHGQVYIYAIHVLGEILILTWPNIFELIKIVKDFLFHSTFELRNGNLLKICVSEIGVK